MSGNFNDGPLTHIAREFQRHAALPPPQKAVARTSYGSLLLVACAYTAFDLGPAAVSEFPPYAMYGLIAAAGLGLLLFINGLRGPRLPPDPMTRFWSLLWAVAFGAGSWWLAVNQPGIWEIFFVRCFCVSFAVAQALEFLLLLRPLGGDARGQVAQNIDENEFRWE
jgi:apolipoprotein N-acyltransferase